MRPARDDAKRSEPAPEEWLLIEWPESAAEPDHYWLSTLPAEISPEHMVDQAKLRWRIERDYLELKQEASVTMKAAAGVASTITQVLCRSLRIPDLREETIPPSGPARTWRGTKSTLPDGYRPRGSAAAFATPHAELNRHVAYPPSTNFGRTAAVSLLRTQASDARANRLAGT